MRIAVLPSDETGCGTYRLIWPAAVVQRERPDWQIDIYRPSQVSLLTDDAGQMMAISGVDLDRVDVVIMQRNGTPQLLALQRWLQAQGIAVVHDCDDALWAIHKDNAAYRSWNTVQTNWRHVDQASEEADLVTVTTPRLMKRYGHHGRAELLPNRVPAGVLDIETRYDEDEALITIGWTGHVQTHPTDLHVVGNAVQRVLEEQHTAGVMIVGPGTGILDAWGLDTMRDRVSATGAVPIDNYFDAMTLIDIGLVPLDGTLFNNCKSGLKASEFSALGKPVVATPTPAHWRLMDEGYPIEIAETADQWHRAISRLVSDADWYAERSAIARQAARRHTLEAHAGEWAAAWERAASRRKRLSA